MSVLKQYNALTSTWEPVVVGAMGPQGPAGPAGPPGPAGAVGGAYAHTQGTATTLWVITHNLGYKPGVTSFDAYGIEIEGDTQHVSVNQCTITFAYAVSGSALLS